MLWWLGIGPNGRACGRESDGQTVTRKFVPSVRGLRLAVLSALAAVVGFGPSPAAANPLTDCFERIAVATHHVPRPHRAKPHPAVHKARHVVPKRRHKVRKVAVANPAKAYEHRTRYILRPKACGTHEAMATPVPGAPVPDAPQVMLAALAGPAETPDVGVADVGPLVSTLPPVVGDSFTPGGFVPGGGPGVTPVGGFVFPGGGPGGPGGPGQPPVGPPTQPPVIPPDQPPVVPPDQPPPVIPPVIPPPPVFPPVVPPVVPPVITPPGGIPEPATWAMMITGFFGVGVALRRRKPSVA